MKSLDLKFSMIRNQRSTRCTSLFQELEQSNSNLNDDAEVDLLVSRLQLWKQMLYIAWKGEWMMKNNSSMLNLDGISNCHESAWTSTAAISSRILLYPASIIFNNTCGWCTNQEQSKRDQENWWKKLREFWDETFRSEIMKLLLMNSVRIIIIYPLLMMLIKHV